MRAIALSLCLIGCSTTTELRVVDPHAIRIENKKGKPIALPAKDRADSSCTWRDNQGFPHFCFAGGIDIDEDGLITLRGAPAFAHDELRVPFPILQWAWCRRSRRMCQRPTGELTLVTPRRNVTELRER